MGKPKTVFVCQVCGFESTKWMGKCPSCGEWNTFVEEERDDTPRGKTIIVSEKVYPKSIVDVEFSDKKRIPTGLKQFDDILNGGLVEGQVSLVAGEPGIGKSTLVLQIADRLAKIGKVLYVNSEESNEQIKIRGIRLGVNNQNIFLFPENKLENIVDTILSGQYRFLIVDSIQNIYSDRFLSSPGSITQVREATTRITEIAKYKNIITFIIGHINKEGMIAGPKAIEHIVDTIIVIDKDSKGSYRILRTVKNRFGPTNSVALYNLSSSGLEDIPDLAFFSTNTPSLVGSVLCCVVEGVRGIVVEVQSLVNATQFGFAKRTADGIDINRLYMISAILDRYLNTKLSNYDIYLNITSGFEVKETGTDLAVALSIISSLKDKEVPRDLSAFGEIGLAGEVRPVPYFDLRIPELKRVGVRKILVPKNNKTKDSHEGIEIIEIENIYDLLSFL